MTKGSHDFVSLHEAFDQLGDALFKDDWKQDCWRLSPGPFPERFDGPRLYDPKKIAPERLTSKAERYETDQASDKQWECYYTTLKTLKNGLWHKDFDVVYVPSSDQNGGVTNLAWRDNSDRYTVSLPCSLLIRKNGNRLESWEVEVEKSSFLPFVKVSRKAKEKEDRIRRAFESYSFSYEQYTFNPDLMTFLVEEVYNEAKESMTNEEWARAVRRIYKSWGKKVDDVPSQQTVLRSVREFKKR